MCFSLLSFPFGPGLTHPTLTRKQYYKPGPLDEEEGAADRAGAGSSVASDPNIYFEDAAFRPSWLDRLYQGAWDDFHPSQVPDEEVEHLRELAERYEEQLFAILAQKEGGVGGGAGAGGSAQGQGGGKGAGGKGGFDPAAFADEMDVLGGGGEGKKEG